MADKENSFDMTDWELSEEYYKENEENKELKLEDFMLLKTKFHPLVQMRLRIRRLPEPFLMFNRFFLSMEKENL